MLTCREAEKMVMPYIDNELNEAELEAFIQHVELCPACREELEIYYTVFLGLRQLESGTGMYDVAGALEESLETSAFLVRATRLRKVISYAVGTLLTVGVLTTFLIQVRIWADSGFLHL
jgi:hypothetical protein